MKLRTFATALALSASMLATQAFADTITMWTMEEQPDRMAAQEKIAEAFKAKSGHEVKIVPVTEKDIATRTTAAFGAGDLPDVLNHTVQHLLPFASAGILDAGAATEVIENLGADTFASGPLNMAKSNGQIVYEQLEEAVEKTGVPRQILSDHGTDIKSGIERFCQVHKQTCFQLMNKSSS